MWTSTKSSKGGSLEPAVARPCEDDEGLEPKSSGVDGCVPEGV